MRRTPFLSLPRTKSSRKAEEHSVFIPGRHKLGKDEILEPDQSVYEMLHRMNVTWPCLSFDVLRDRLGEERKRYPATAYVVTGTQADAAKNNEVLVMKMSQLHKTQKDDGEIDAQRGLQSELMPDDVLQAFPILTTTMNLTQVRSMRIPFLSSALYHTWVLLTASVHNRYLRAPPSPTSQLRTMSLPGLRRGKSTSGTSDLLLKLSTCRAINSIRQRLIRVSLPCRTMVEQRASPWIGRLHIARLPT